MKCRICNQHMPKEMSWCHFLMHFPYLLEIYHSNFSEEEAKKYFGEP